MYLLFVIASRSLLNPWVQGLRLASKASVRRKHRLRPIRLKTAHRAVFLTPNPILPQHSFVDIRHIVWRIFLPSRLPGFILVSHMCVATLIGLLYLSVKR